MKRLTIIVFLCLFLIPIGAMAIGHSWEGDPVYNYDRIVEHSNRQMVEIAFNVAGTGVYLEFECNSTLNMHLINSTARLAILQYEEWDPVNGINLIERLSGNVSFVLPYDDTFYLLFVNLNPTIDSDLIGW